MPAAETARLVAELSLKDKLTPGAKTAIGSVNKLDTSLSRMGATARRGAATAGKAMLGLGAVVAVGIGAGVKSGLENLATLESAVTSVDGAIAQMGLTGQVTGAQVATMANDIEASIGAAFDDKAIVSATSTLLRFGKVTPGNLKPAMVVMTDLAAKTGSVDSAATLLAKALADPTKAAGKLARSGVILTKAQQDQIKALVKAGKTGKAQAVILDALATSTKGAAEASQGPYQRALSTLADVTEDAQKALATGFLPVIERVAKWLSTSLADPKVMSDIRGLGDTLAGAFDQGVSFVQKIPWGTVKDAMGVAATAAKGVLDAFTSLPPWVQTAVISGWGLNKISGGAISGIIGELGKALLNSAVMNVKAGVVNVLGGGGKDVPGGGGGGKGTPTAGGKGGSPKGVPEPSGPKGNLPGVVALAVAIAAGVHGDTPSDAPARDIQLTRTIEALRREIAAGRGNQPAAGGKETNAQQLARLLAPALSAAINKTVANDPTGFRNSSASKNLEQYAADTRSETIGVRKGVEDVKTQEAAALVAFRSGERTTAAVGAATAMASRMAGATSAMATAASAGRVVGAIAANRPVVTTSVVVNVTAASVSKSVAVSSRYGAGNGSAGGGNRTSKPG